MSLLVTISSIKRRVDVYVNNELQLDLIEHDMDFHSCHT